MRKPRAFLVIAMGAIFVLLAGALVYATLRDDDPYRYFTGLGEHISVAADDSKIAFSYYVDGNESIYTANPDGTKVKKITKSANRRDSRPKYSPDGKQFVYLSKDSEGIQALRLVNADGSGEKPLTDDKLHVNDAVFSQDGKTVYFVAIEAKEFKKGEESSAGFDLISIGTDGKGMKKLTDVDYFMMDHLFLSPEGNTIYFSDLSGGEERIFSYSFEDKKVNGDPSIIPKKVAKGRSFYNSALSPDGEYLAFTEVTPESEESDLYEYELFLLDIKKEKVDRLTHLKKAVISPVFFHKENKIAFLEHTNWADAPEVFKLKTIDAATHKMKAVELDAPRSKENHRFMQTVDRAVNSYTIGVLYILLFVLLSVYMIHYRTPAKPFLPAIISFAISLTTLAVSFGVAMIGNPWAGIGLGMLAAGIFACSIIIVVLVFIYKLFVKK